MLAPPVMQAAEAPVKLSPGAIHDVALGEDSTLAGEVADLGGQPLPDVDVLVLQAGNSAAHVRTAADGRFHLAPLKGGVYEVSGGGGGGIYRVWSRGSAPPGAAGSIHIVAGAVRGQGPRTGFLHSDAFLIGAAVLGAVSIPIVILAARRENPPAS
jgi:hypothetical protein